MSLSRTFTCLRRRSRCGAPPENGCTVSPDADDRAAAHRRLLSWGGGGYARPRGCDGGEAGGASDWWIPWERWRPNSPARGSRTATWWRRRLHWNPAPRRQPDSSVGCCRPGCSACRRNGHGGIGGSALTAPAGLDRLFRDIQGVRYHRPQARMRPTDSGWLGVSHRTLTATPESARSTLAAGANATGHHDIRGRV